MCRKQQERFWGASLYCFFCILYYIAMADATAEDARAAAAARAIRARAPGVRTSADKFLTSFRIQISFYRAYKFCMVAERRF